MAPSKPTIIFVPGAWHGPEPFSTVRASLESHGYTTIGISLPSVGAEPPVKSWDPDVDAIRSAIAKVADEEGGDVVLAVHSYGGVPSSEAAKGFAKTEREKAGLKGGIVRLVYICATLLDIGKSMFDMGRPENAGELASFDVCNPLPFLPFPSLPFPTMIVFYSPLPCSTPIVPIPRRANLLLPEP